MYICVVVHLVGHETVQINQINLPRVIDNNNSIQFFIIYVPIWQLQVQLQTQYSVDTGYRVKDKHNIITRDKLQANTGERNTLIQKNFFFYLLLLLPIYNLLSYNKY
jgi:hypothetical protein